MSEHHVSCNLVMRHMQAVKRKWLGRYAPTWNHPYLCGYVCEAFWRQMTTKCWREMSEARKRVAQKLWSMREVLVGYYPLERAESGPVWKCGFQIGDFFCPFPHCQRSAVSLHRPTVSVCSEVANHVQFR